MKASILIGAVATCITSHASANSSDWYIGGTLTHNVKTETDAPDSSLGGSLALGYYVSTHWAVEGSTGSYGRLNMMTAAEHHHSTQKETRYSSDLSLIGSLSLSKHYKFYGGFGFSKESSNIEPVAQLGIRYDLSKYWRLSLGYKFIINQDPEYKLQSLGLGIQYRLNTASVPVTKPVYDDIHVATKSHNKNASTINAESTCKPKLYRVKNGDWLYKIARKHNSTLTKLASLNSQFETLENINEIYPGQTIWVPNFQCQ